MTTSNVQNFGVKPFVCGLCFHLSFEPFMTTFPKISKSVDHGKMWSIFQMDHKNDVIKCSKLSSETFPSCNDTREVENCHLPPIAGTATVRIVRRAAH